MADFEQRIRVIVEVIENNMRQMTKQMTDSLNRLHNTLLKNNKMTSTLVKNMRNLSINLLAVGFFGRMVAQTFGNMLKPAAEAMGIFELWNTTLTVFFLPIMQQILPYLLDFMNWMMNIPEPIQKAVGAIAVLATVLGTMISTLAFWGIGLDKIFGFIAALGPKIGGFVGGVSASVAALAAAVVAIAYGIWLAWQENFGKIRDWVAVIVQGLKEIWLGFSKFLTGLWEVISGVISGDTDKLVKGLKDIWFGFWGFVGGVLKSVLGLVVTIGEGILRVIKGIFDTAIGLIQKLINKEKELPIIGGLVKGMTAPFEKSKSSSGSTSQSSSINVTQNTNVTVSDKYEMQRLIDEANRKSVDDIVRRVKTGVSS